MSIEITMPRLSDTMETGTIIKWNVKEGDAVSAGDVVADVETDKATMEMQVYDDGTIARIMVGEGETVDVGTRIALLAEEDEELDDVAATSGNGAAAAGAEADAADDERKPQGGADDEGRDRDREKDQVAGGTGTDEPERAGDGPPDGRRRVSPVARQLAEDHDIDLGMIQGSGPSGRIIKRDVLKAVEAGQETAAAVPPSAMTRRDEPEETGGKPSAPVTSVVARVAVPDLGGGLEDGIVPLSNMRQTIARRLVESKTTIPHYQVTVTFDMDPLLSLRRMLNEQLAPHGLKLSVNDFLVRGCALAMHEHPQFNASFEGDSVRIHGEVNVGIAVSLPEERGGGLVVATIRQADRKSLRAISLEAKQLAEKARMRGLSVEEMADATFTLSNLGMFGVDHFTAIINPPNSAILAVGAAIEKPVVRHGELAVGHEMSGTLSLDHRVIDGAMAARYLQTLKRMIESPSTLLV